MKACKSKVHQQNQYSKILLKKFQKMTTFGHTVSLMSALFLLHIMQNQMTSKQL